MLVFQSMVGRCFNKLTGYSYSIHKSAGRFLPIIAVLSVSCNINYYLGEVKNKEKNYEIANVYLHRAVIDDPEDREFKESYQENSKIVFDEIIERYKRYIEEKKFLPAYFLLQRVRKYNYKNVYIKEEEKKWLRVLIAGKVNFNFVSLSNYFVGASEAEVQIRFNTPNQNRKITANINILNGVYFVEDYLYNPQSEFLMFYTLNGIGINQISDINGVENRINLQFEPSNNQGGQDPKSRYKTPLQIRDVLTSKDFLPFIDFSFPVLSEVKGTLDVKSDYATFLRYYPTNMLRENTSEKAVYGGGSIRFTANLLNDKIAINSSTGIIDYMPQIMYTNTDNNRVFLDFGVFELTLELESSLWNMKRIIPEQPKYREFLMSNVMLRPYLISIDGAYPYTKSG